MDCNATRQTFLDAQRKREDARLRALVEAENARFIAENINQRIYDWATVRIAQREVRRWEARCDCAEAALVKCLKNEKPQRDMRPTQ